MVEPFLFLLGNACTMLKPTVKSKLLGPLDCVQSCAQIYPDHAKLQNMIGKPEASVHGKEFFRLRSVQNQGNYALVGTLAVIPKALIFLTISFWQNKEGFTLYMNGPPQVKNALKLWLICVPGMALFYPLELARLRVMLDFNEWPDNVSKKLHT